VKRTWALAAALALATALAVRLIGTGSVRLEVGAYANGFLREGWSSGWRGELDPPATTDGRLTFYYRAANPGSAIVLPLAPRDGTLRLVIRGVARVRHLLGVYVSGRQVAQLLVPTLPWTRHVVDVPPGTVQGSALDVRLAMAPRPLVPGDHGGRPELLVDYVDIESPRGFVVAPSACLVLGLVPLAVFAFGRLIGTRPRLALGIAGGASLAILAMARFWPLSLIPAAPRIVPLALLAGLAVYWLLGRLRLVAPGDRTALAWLMAAGLLAHGAVAFFPNHYPPGIDPFVRRTLDLPRVPFEYQAMLRYGSQFASESQRTGDASVALGKGSMVPYSPFPFLAFYIVHALGFDLYWALTATIALAAMAVAPLVWLAAQWTWDRFAAWLAAGLYVLDLPVWHHVGRVHAAGAFGQALGTAGLLYLVLRVESLDTTRRSLLAGGILGLAVLAYSSLPVLVGLFGLVLLVSFVVDAGALSRAVKARLALALVVGGLVAGGLYYFHYVPGLLRGAPALEAEPDLYPGRTFLVFHNEAKESMRIWLAGFWAWLLAGLAAAPFALRRGRASVRPLLVSWLLAWVLVMVLKEPFLFPKLLRWAKEDQFLSPLLCLLIGGAVAATPRRLRWSLAALLLAGALVLQVRDYMCHANSLFF
jgi:hypothetical protein